VIRAKCCRSRESGLYRTAQVTGAVRGASVRAHRANILPLSFVCAAIIGWAIITEQA
jgi:hypothetical protein